MVLLIVGVVLFLGVHGLTMQRGLRAQLVERFGANGYKGLYSAGSLVGLVVLIYGFGVARAGGPPVVWTPPAFLGHVAALLMAFAFVSLIAAYAPNGKIRSTLKHPMLTAVKAWAFAHLLVNGDLASIVLFGSFLAWAVACRISIKRRPDAVEPPPASWGAGDAAALVGGVALTVAFMLWLHPWLIGVPARLA